MKGFISFLIVFVSVVGGYAIGYTHRGVICQSDVKIEKEQARYEQHFSDMPTIFVDKDGRREYMVDGKEFVDLKSYQTMQSAYELMSKINDANTALLNRQHKLITHLIALVRLASNNPATKHLYGLECNNGSCWTPGVQTQMDFDPYAISPHSRNEFEWDLWKFQQQPPCAGGTSTAELKAYHPCFPVSPQ